MEEEEDVFKKEYVAHIKSIVLNPDMNGLRAKNFAAFLDKVTDVFEYMITHLDRSRRFLTPNFRQVAIKTASDNLHECRKKILLKNEQDPRVVERLLYLCLVLEQFLLLV